jgi:hypothetical protein
MKCREAGHQSRRRLVVNTLKEDERLREDQTELDDPSSRDELGKASDSRERSNRK